MSMSGMPIATSPTMCTGAANSAYGGGRTSWGTSEPIIATSRSCNHGMHAVCHPAIVCHRDGSSDTASGSAPASVPECHVRCAAGRCRPRRRDALHGRGLLEVVGHHRTTRLERVDTFGARHVEQDAAADDAVRHLRDRAPRRAELGRHEAGRPVVVEPALPEQVGGRVEVRHVGPVEHEPEELDRRTTSPRPNFVGGSPSTGVAVWPVDTQYICAAVVGSPKAVPRSREHDTTRPAVTARGRDPVLGCDQVQSAALVVGAEASPVRAAVDVGECLGCVGLGNHRNLVNEWPDPPSTFLASSTRSARGHHPVR